MLSHISFVVHPITVLTDLTSTINPRVQPRLTVHLSMICTSTTKPPFNDE